MSRSREPMRGTLRGLARPARRGARRGAAPARDPWALLVALCRARRCCSPRAERPWGSRSRTTSCFSTSRVLRGNPSWWDGGGGVAYWRPLARQAYFGLFGPLMLSHPAVVAALHALALAAAGVLLHRALRRAWPAPAAALAASFPVVLEVGAHAASPGRAGRRTWARSCFWRLRCMRRVARARGAARRGARRPPRSARRSRRRSRLLVAFAPFPRPAGIARARPLVIGGGDGRVGGRALRAARIRRARHRHDALPTPLSSAGSAGARAARHGLCSRRATAFSLDRRARVGVCRDGRGALLPAIAARSRATAAAGRRAGAGRCGGWRGSWRAWRRSRSTCPTGSRFAAPPGGGARRDAGGAAGCRGGAVAAAAGGRAAGRAAVRGACGHAPQVRYERRGRVALVRAHRAAPARGARRTHRADADRAATCRAGRACCARAGRS